jgi:glycosyltransferase involved in cell wall biosynthesis
MKKSMNYLLVTQIPFTRNQSGAPVVDRLWGRDLVALAKSFGSVRVVAPEIPASEKFDTWGPDATPMSSDSGVTFVGFPVIQSRLDLWKWPAIRAVLRREVKKADLVHSSNPFAPYVGLRYAHDLAVKLGKKTLVVVAEDFVDMLDWEWVRTGTSAVQRLRRASELRRLEKTVQQMLASASLSFLHTPATVQRFRLAAKNSIAIRHPLHDAEDVISIKEMEWRFADLQAGRPIRIASACRHSGLKGLEMLIQAIGLLKDRGIRVEASLYGRGSDTSHLRTLIESRGLQDQVALPGTVSPGKPLYDTLSRFDLFAMVHRTTDFGRAFWDAMACALPVIAFRTPAAAGTVCDGSDGFITPLDDPQSLSEKLAHLHENRHLLVDAARAARRRALDNTRTQWFTMRAQWVRDLFLSDACEEPCALPGKPVVSVAPTAQSAEEVLATVQS